MTAIQFPFIRFDMSVFIPIEIIHCIHVFAVTFDTIQKCRKSVVFVFDFIFDESIKSVVTATTPLTSSLTCVKGKVKVTGIFDNAFDPTR